jgi:CheY-like chemotaxis protein
MKTVLIDDVREPQNIRNPFTGGFFGADVVVARTAGDGIVQILANLPIDVLLLDHDLGEGMNGMDVLKWLESSPDAMPKQIWLVTANVVAGPRMYEIIENWQEKGLIEAFGWIR